jgi:hypothetical protein
MRFGAACLSEFVREKGVTESDWVYMPKRTIGGFEIYIYLRDERGHRPHVHVFGGTGELVVWLDPVRERANRGMKMSETRRALRIVREHRGELLELWRQYHGH